MCDRVAPELAKLPYRIETDQYGRILAERYYRAMFHGRDESWNLRDTHMFETLNELSAHLDSGRAKVVVRAHNSHLGNARATEMSERGN